jgi:RNA polymerase primary sigma factor
MLETFFFNQTPFCTMRQFKIATQITNRDSQSVEMYLSEISKIPMITPQEETILAIKIKMGDQRALDKLVKANLRFVVSVAKQYQGQGLSLSDLINEGNLGLIKAAQRFDETKGFKFISYAVWWIRQSILLALAENGRITRLPLNEIGLINKVNKASCVLEQRYERLASPQEIAQFLNVSTNAVEYVLTSASKHVSIDQPIEDQSDSSVHDAPCSDLLISENSADAWTIEESRKTEIARSLSILTERQREVVCMFFGIGYEKDMTLDEIGERLDLTSERIRQIKEKAISRLRKSNCTKNLHQFCS